ncbi:hypothetical protein ONS95_011346 [Cadophora gregata]|uniref:uncharacterized protein n=1 Tax=Cadophora gregata TaxID=51156 RepID=UPI0026DBE799|nr:uncharacterized protein ONS95_011346 [Cadophora gregata]KAK0119921.1 hypothetical protein ONS95_011346 [Cadophora gregata]KAK0120954.1 hypothetical protein ONS96_011149 [Cadophora gregata f. sp. sojae]
MELRRLIAIKTFTADEDGSKIMPTNMMDELWVAAIIDTQIYANLRTALGIKLHRRYGVSSPDTDHEPRTLRLSTMKSLYKNFFGSEPLSPAYQLRPQMFMNYPQPAVSPPESITFEIGLLTGRTFPLTIARKATVLRMKEEITKGKGIAIEKQRLIALGRKLVESW